jgi:hypothetical protein
MVDKMRADIVTQLEEAELKRAQARSTGLTGDRTEFDLGLDKELRDVSADMRRANLRSIKMGTRVLLNDDERRAATTASSLKEAGERILNMRLDRAKGKEEIKRIRSHASLLRKQGVMYDLDNELRANGVQPGDPLLLRILSRILSGSSIRKDFNFNLNR